MEQEGGRRRSTRLAAKGASPKVETPVKRTVKKSDEKPKRAKRKEPEEEVIDSMESKKFKVSSDETEKPDEHKINDIEKVDEPDVSSLNKEENENPTTEQKDDEPVSDSQKEPESNSTANKKEDIVIDEKSIDEQILEVAAQLQNDEPEEIPEPVSMDKNGNSYNDKVVESIKTINNDNGFCVTEKDSVTSNGDAEAQINTANGEKEEPKPESVEPIKVLHDNTNHVAENDLKSVTLPVSINTTPNNVVLDVKQDEKEQDKVVDSEINITVSANDNAPNMDQTPAIVS